MLFIKRDADKILKSMLDRVKADTSITVTSPGSVARSLFEIISDELGLHYRFFDANMQQLFISTASGEALDKIGELFGVWRTQTVGTVGANSGSVYFYLNSSANHVPGTADVTASEPITIPSNTFVSTDPIGTGYNPVVWRTVGTATIPVGGYLAYVTVEPVNSIQKTVGAGTMVNHNLSDTFLNIYAFNKRDLETNPSTESDDNFRYRIHKAIHSVATGNATSLRLAALSVSGVKDCRVMPLAEGVGTVSVIVILERPGTVEGTDVFNLAGEEVRKTASVGDLVFVERPNEVPVDITGSVLTRAGVPSSGVKTAVEQSITRYLETLSIGEPIIYSKLIADAMNVSPDIREFALVDGGFMVGGRAVARTNYRPKEKDQVYPRTITIL